MDSDGLWNLLGIIASAAGCYAAIKADLTRAVVTAEHAMESAALAHQRLDSHLSDIGKERHG